MDQIYSQMHILTSYCACVAQWLRIAETKSTKFRLCPACTCVSHPFTLADKHVYKWGCPAWQCVASKMDIVVGRGDPACLSTASCSLVWAAPISSPGEITGKTDCNNRNFIYNSGQAFCKQC